MGESYELITVYRGKDSDGFKLSAHNSEEDK